MNHRSWRPPALFALTVAAALPGRALPPNPATVIGSRGDGTPIRADQDLRNLKDMDGWIFPEGTDLEDADFSHSNLTGARLHGVNLTNARFTDATVPESVWEGALFRNTTMPDGSVRNSKADFKHGAPAAKASASGAAAPAPAPLSAAATASILKAPLPKAPSAAAIAAFKAEASPSAMAMAKRLTSIKPISLLPYFITGKLPAGTIRELSLGDIKVDKMISTHLGPALLLHRTRLLCLMTPAGFGLAELEAEPQRLGVEGTLLWYTGPGARELYAQNLPQCFGNWQKADDSYTVSTVPAPAGTQPEIVVSGQSTWYLYGRILMQRLEPHFAKTAPTKGHPKPVQATDGKDNSQVLQRTYQTLAPGTGGSVMFHGGPFGGILRPNPAGGAKAIEFQGHATKDITRMFMASDGRVYYFCKGEDALFRARFTASALAGVDRFPLPGPANAEPFDLSEGPGGNIWFTEREGNAIGMFDVKSEALNRYPLPIPGSLPETILQGQDGAMQFTEAGSDRIGLISAVPPPPSAAGARKARKKAPPLPAATATAPPAQGLPVPPSTMDQKTPAAAPPTPAPPRRWIRATLPWRHIKTEHAFGRDNAKGQFSLAKSSHKAVEDLVSFALTYPDYPRILTWEGRWLVLKDMKEMIGYTWDPVSGWVPTDMLLVVLSGSDQVITAYPVKNVKGS